MNNGNLKYDTELRHLIKSLGNNIRKLSLRVKKQDKNMETIRDKRQESLRINPRDVSFLCSKRQNKENRGKEFIKKII